MKEMGRDIHSWLVVCSGGVGFLLGVFVFWCGLFVLILGVLVFCGLLFCYQLHVLLQ